MSDVIEGRRVSTGFARGYLPVKAHSCRSSGDARRARSSGSARVVSQCVANSSHRCETTRSPNFRHVSPAPSTRPALGVLGWVHASNNQGGRAAAADPVLRRGGGDVTPLRPAAEKPPARFTCDHAPPTEHYYKGRAGRVKAHSCRSSGDARRARSSGSARVVSQCVANSSHRCETTRSPNFRHVSPAPSTRPALGVLGWVHASNNQGGRAAAADPVLRRGGGDVTPLRPAAEKPPARFTCDHAPPVIRHEISLQPPQRGPWTLRWQSRELTFPKCSWPSPSQTRGLSRETSRSRRSDANNRSSNVRTFVRLRTPLFRSRPPW